MLGTSDAWLMSHLSKRTSNPTYHIVDCRISWICVGAGEIAQNFTLSVGVNEIWTRKTLQDH